jgi:hypothetical protein
MLEAERDLTLSQAPVPVATAGDAKKLLYLRVFVGKVHYQRVIPLRICFGQMEGGPRSDQLITFARRLHQPLPIKDRNLPSARCN